MQIQLRYVSVKGTCPSSEVPRHKKDWSRQEASGAHAARASPAHECDSAKFQLSSVMPALSACVNKGWRVRDRKKAVASRCPLYKELKELDDVGPNSSCHDVNPQVPVPSTKHQAPSTRRPWLSIRPYS